MNGKHIYFNIMYATINPIECAATAQVPSTYIIHVICTVNEKEFKKNGYISDIIWKYVSKCRANEPFSKLQIDRYREREIDRWL